MPVSFLGRSRSLQSSIVADFVGPFQTVAQTSALGGDFATFESKWVTYNEPQWTAFATTWSFDEQLSGSAGYDRAKGYYVWWARLLADNPSLAATYLARGHSLAVHFRDKYASLGEYNEPWRQFTGLTLHYLLTGDTASKAAIGDVADIWAYYTAQTSDPSYIGSTSNTYNCNRTQTSALEALLCAWRINAPSDGATGGFPGGNTWATVLRDCLTKILNTQAGDGGWRFSAQSSWTYPYQVGMLANKLIEYYRVFEADSRIPAAIKLSQDFLWANMRDATTNPNTFYYIEGDNTAGGDPPYSTTGEYDLNGWHLAAYGFLRRFYADTTYTTRGDALLAAAMQGDGANPPGAYVSSYKQFSETYCTGAYKYSYFRQIGIT